jgi:hypothetical protein
MKGRPLILIFLFLALLLSPVNCETGSLIDYVLSDVDYGFNKGQQNLYTGDFRFLLNHDSGGIPDSYAIKDVHGKNLTNYSSTPGNLGDPYYIYYSSDGTTKTELIGYGSIRIYKKSDYGDVAGSNAFNIDIYFTFDNIDGFDTELTGPQYYILDGAWNSIYAYYNLYRDGGSEYNDVYTNLHAHMSTTAQIGDYVTRGSSGSQTNEYSSFGSFRNDYEFDATASYFDIDVQKQGFNGTYDLSSSKIKMVNYTDDTTYYQSSFTSSNSSHFLGVNTYNYYIVREIDDYEYLIYTSYEEEEEGSGEDHTAIISFNESHYIKPDRVNVSWDGSLFSFVHNEYWVTVMGSQDGVSNWQYIDYDYEPEISSDEEDGNRSVALYYNSFNLPFYIKAMIYSYNYHTGDTTVLDTSDIILYSDTGIKRGSIWTDKSNYNVTELVEISYTTNVAENYIAVEEPNSLWSTHDVPVGTYSFLYELSTSAVGNTTIYLFENSELADQVTISVSSESGDDAYAAWMKDYYFEGETASFYYYSSNASAQITVYDGADIVVFGPATTQLGYHNGRVNTANTNPGTFLLSLYHNGTYYNDTMIFESVDSWVRFDSSKYNVGDTINIEYYLADPTHQISMWDAHVGLVIRFTTNYGVLVSGSMETVPFTLSEDNEYSYDVPGKLSSGDLTLGYWTVFIEERNGVLGDSWDEAYVCYATDDGSYGTDASNEMISIFFSPEGAFMLYTVCLTMMGLVLAKHPAGGGAGATVRYIF